jgi:hypothetical protein
MTDNLKILSKEGLYALQQSLVDELDNVDEEIRLRAFVDMMARVGKEGAK